MIANGRVKRYQIARREPVPILRCKRFQHQQFTRPVGWQWQRLPWRSVDAVTELDRFDAVVVRDAEFYFDLFDRSCLTIVSRPDERDFRRGVLEHCDLELRTYAREQIVVGNGDVPRTGFVDDKCRGDDRLARFEIQGFAVDHEAPGIGLPIEGHVHVDACARKRRDVATRQFRGFEAGPLRMAQRDADGFDSRKVGDANAETFGRRRVGPDVVVDVFVDRDEHKAEPVACDRRHPGGLPSRRVFVTGVQGHVAGAEACARCVDHDIRSRRDDDVAGVDFDTRLGVRCEISGEQTLGGEFPGSVACHDDERQCRERS